jgi:hypothetical protein
MLKITTFLKNSVFGRFLGSLKTVKNDHFPPYDKKVIKMDHSEKSLIKKLKKRKNAVFGDFHAQNKRTPKTLIIDLDRGYFELVCK